MLIFTNLIQTINNKYQLLIQEYCTIIPLYWQQHLQKVETRRQRKKVVLVLIKKMKIVLFLFHNFVLPCPNFFETCYHQIQNEL